MARPRSCSRCRGRRRGFPEGLRHCPAAVSAPARARATLPGRGSVPLRLPRGAAAARRRDRPPPGRRAGWQPTAPNKRPRRGPETSRGDGPSRAASPGSEPASRRPRMAGGQGLRPPVPLSPPLTAASGPAAGTAGGGGEVGEPGEKDAMQQLRRRGGGAAQ